MMTKQKLRERVFSDVKIGETFKFNGTVWLKRSTRTAQVHNGYPQIHYFGKNEILYPQTFLVDYYD